MSYYYLKNYYIIQANLSYLTNRSIIETFKKIKRDKNPFSNKKITLSIYKEFLKKNKI